MSEPSSSSGDGEQDWEIIGWETHSLVDNTRVEIDVGVQFSLDEIFITQGSSFEFNSNFDEGLLADNFEDFRGDLRDNEK